jgi:T5SS/PEP-CTERM-associated repeat protein
MSLGAFALLLGVGPAAAMAAVTATGDFNPNPLVDGESLSIGFNAYGTFRIDGGSSFESNFVEAGDEPSGFGVATVTDPGSKWTFFGGTFGDRGYGRLEILNGGVVEIPNANILAFGGNSGNGRGTAIVDGDGSLLHVYAPLQIGTSGAGTMRIADGAIVNVPEYETTIGNRGRIELDGGLFRTSRLEGNGVISGSGQIDVTSCCGQEYGGRIEVGAGEELRISHFSNSEVRNFGEINIEGGQLEFGNFLVNERVGDRSGQIQLNDGTLRAGPIGGGNFDAVYRNRGLVTTIGGVNHLYGTLRNESGSDVAVVNKSMLMLHNDVVADFDSTISVFAGSTAVFLQDLRLNGGTLLADLAGVDGYGHVEVVGDVFLNGQLQVNLSNGYLPQLGDSFQLLSGAGSVNGSLELSPTAPLPTGLEWDVVIGAGSVVLSVISDLEGDYNGDGSVDAADYTVWRDTLGSGSELAADGNGNQRVDAGDHAVWKANFGSTLGSGSAQSLQAVPEPATCLMFALAIACWLPASRRPR